MQVTTIALAQATRTDPKLAPIDLEGASTARVAALAIWTAKLRTGRVVTFRASGSRVFRAAALTGPVAAGDLAVIASGGAGGAEGAALGGVGDSVAVAAGFAVGVGDEISASNVPVSFRINSYLNKRPKGENTKKRLTLTNIASAAAVLALMVACQTATTNQAELAASKKEFLLAQSGFKVI